MNNPNKPLSVLIGAGLLLSSACTATDAQEAGPQASVPPTSTERSFDELADDSSAVIAIAEQAGDELFAGLLEGRKERVYVGMGTCAVIGIDPTNSGKVTLMSIASPGLLIEEDSLGTASVGQTVAYDSTWGGLLFGTPLVIDSVRPDSITKSKGIYEVDFEASITLDPKAGLDLQAVAIKNNSIVNEDGKRVMYVAEETTQIPYSERAFKDYMKSGKAKRVCAKAATEAEAQSQSTQV